MRNLSCNRLTLKNMAETKPTTKKYYLLSDHFKVVDKKLTKFEAGSEIELTASEARSLVNKIKPLQTPKPAKK